jgi:hypothetical protein
MEKKSIVPYLEQVLPHEASKLVGKCMKRFEILDSKDILKKEIKELIYESLRDLIQIIDAYEKGAESTYFNFKNGNKTEEVK